MSLPVIDDAVLGTLRETLGDEVMESLIQTYIDDTSSRMVQAAQYFDQNDIEQLGREGHAIKGASANLGIARVAQSGEDLQHACKANDHDKIPEIVNGLKANVDDALAHLKDLLSQL